MRSFVVVATLLLTVEVVAGGTKRPAPAVSPSPVLVPAAPSLAPVDPRAAAEELLAMELAGWRKINPSDRCWKGKSFRYLKAAAFGGNSEESGDPKIVLAENDPAPRILDVRADPEDATLYHVSFEVVAKGRKPKKGRLTFSVNEVNVEKIGRVSLIAQPDFVFYRKSCQP